MINKDKVNIDMSMKWNKGQKKRSIHTTLKPSTIAKLEEYGDGKLNNGIEKVIKIAESQQNDLRNQLNRIASQIITEEIEMVSNHATLKPNTIEKLEEYVDGKINNGIEKVIKIAESRQNSLRDQLNRIASQIITEEIEMVSNHTTLKPNTIEKLEEYVDGKINNGIKTVIEIAESRQNNIREQLNRIESQIITEEIEMVSNLN